MFILRVEYFFMRFSKVFANNENDKLIKGTEGENKWSMFFVQCY